MRELKNLELCAVAGGEVQAYGGGDYYYDAGGGGGFETYAYTDGDRTVDGAGSGGSGNITLPTVYVTYNASTSANFTARMVDDCTAGNPVACTMDLFQALRDAASAAGL